MARRQAWRKLTFGDIDTLQKSPKTLVLAEWL